MHLKDKQKRAEYFLSNRFRGKQVCQARVPMPRGKAAHKTPKRMWLAGHSPWIMTALPKNVGAQQRMLWKPFKSLPGKPQPAIHHLQCVWAGSCFSLSSWAPSKSRSAEKRFRGQYSLLVGDLEDKAPVWKSLWTALGSLPLTAFKCQLKAPAPIGLGQSLTEDGPPRGS